MNCIDACKTKICANSPLQIGTFSSASLIPIITITQENFYIKFYFFVLICVGGKTKVPVIHTAVRIKLYELFSKNMPNCALVPM